MEEFNLKLCVQFVPSEKNKSDAFTKVKKAWIGVLEDLRNGVATVVSLVDTQELKEMHSLHHFGIDRTLFLARKIDPNVSREAVKRVVKSCGRCQSIDQAPIVHTSGIIHVGDNWKRVAIDVTHYRNELYLSIADCGPGRVAIWRKLGTGDFC